MIYSMPRYSELFLRNQLLYKHNCSSVQKRWELQREWNMPQLTKFLHHWLKLRTKAIQYLYHKISLQMSFQ